MNFIDEIGKNNNLKYIVPYHEQSLSMQVDTLARLNGFAAGFATSGPEQQIYLLVFALHITTQFLVFILLGK